MKSCGVVPDSNLANNPLRLSLRQPSPKSSPSLAGKLLVLGEVGKRTTHTGMNEGRSGFDDD
jgi:hypothetical protein